MTNYGYCPRCGAEGNYREIHPNGNDRCTNDHIYPSAQATKRPLQLSQVTPVKGYQPQSAEKLAMVNHNKTEEEIILRRLDHMQQFPPDFDLRWLAIARSHFEQGYMALNRAIFKPARVKLDGEE